MGVKVVKFGGSSLAAAEGFRRVKEIIDADDKRRFCVPSAPGKRFSEDTKVTDLLYRCYSCLQRQLPMDEEFDRVGERYRQIASDLRWISTWKACWRTPASKCRISPRRTSAPAGANT